MYEDLFPPPTETISFSCHLVITRREEKGVDEGRGWTFIWRDDGEEQQRLLTSAESGRNTGWENFRILLLELMFQSLLLCLAFPRPRRRFSCIFFQNGTLQILKRFLIWTNWRQNSQRRFIGVAGLLRGRNKKSYKYSALEEWIKMQEVAEDTENWSVCPLYGIP